jgi:hypothetical protein
MATITATIKLTTAGSGTGSFSILQDSDNFTTAIQSGVAKIDVEDVAHLARLELDESEIATLQPQMEEKQENHYLKVSLLYKEQTRKGLQQF